MIQSTWPTRLAGNLSYLRSFSVFGLAITQTIGYGTLYYAYGLVAPRVAQEFAISLDLFFGIFTVGLLLGGLIAPVMGKLIDHKGGRMVMTVGSIFGAVALAVCAWSPNVWVFGAGVLLLEIAACSVLYEAAFATLTQIFHHDARPRITAITLVAGFASTIFWPLTQSLVSAFDWRITFLLFAFVHLFFCAPLHWFCLRDARPVNLKILTPQEQALEPMILAGAARQRALIYYTLAICISGIVYSSVPIHMLRIIENEGFSSQSAALVAMVMGPAQVLARIIDMLGGRKFDALTTGFAALGTLAAALIILLMSSGWMASAVLFAALYGASQGLITIARGAVPLQLFGVHGYGALVGKITGLRFIVNAAGPLGFSMLVTQFGFSSAIAFNALAALVALGAFAMLRRPSA